MDVERVRDAQALVTILTANIVHTGLVRETTGAGVSSYVGPLSWYVTPVDSTRLH